MITVTEAAATKLLSLAQREQVPAALRLGVRGGGCSGLSYFYAFDTEARPDDTVWEAHGVTLRCDPKSMKFLEGVQLDFDTHRLRGGFRFSNPRARTTCSCGESFTL